MHPRLSEAMNREAAHLAALSEELPLRVAWPQSPRGFRPLFPRSASVCLSPATDPILTPYSTSGVRICCF